MSDRSREGLTIIDTEQDVVWMTPGGRVSIGGVEGTVVSIKGTMNGMPIVMIPAEES